MRVRDHTASLNQQGIGYDDPRPFVVIAVTERVRDGLPTMIDFELVTKMKAFVATKEFSYDDLETSLYHRCHHADRERCVHDEGTERSPDDEEFVWQGPLVIRSGRHVAARIALAAHLTSMLPMVSCMGGENVAARVDAEIKFLATVADS